VPQPNRACQVAGGVTITAAAGETESSATSGHSWHVHAAALPMPSDCATAGGHYDPAGVEVAGYSCDSANPGACYKGDLSGKFGSIATGDKEAFADLTLGMAELAGRCAVCRGVLARRSPPTPFSLDAVARSADLRWLMRRARGRQVRRRARRGRRRGARRVRCPGARRAAGLAGARPPLRAEPRRSDACRLALVLCPPSHGACENARR
jgi:hypothetical protein